MLVLDEGGFNGSSPEIQPLSRLVGRLLLFVRVTELLLDISLEVPPTDAPSVNADVVGTFILSFPVGGPGTHRSLLHRGNNDTDLVQVVGDVGISDVSATRRSS